MYTIVDIKGKQYKAVEGSTIEVDFLGEDVKEIEDVKVLLFSEGDSVQVGTPFLDVVKVDCSVVENTKGNKITSIRYKRKTNEKTVKGHRQRYTKIKVNKIIKTA